MVTVVNIKTERCDKEVCRPTIYGNPYTHLIIPNFGVKVTTREEAISKFAELWYSQKMTWLRQRALLEIPNEYKIGCVCAPLRCHADIIAGYLNWKRNFKFESPKARTVIWPK